MYPNLDFSGFEEMHDKDNGKYKVRQLVRYIGPNVKYPLSWQKELIGKEFEVRAANRQDEDFVEYLLAGFPFLVWEEEIEEVK